jgi:PIN domain nuclease of toxin-antitoxin system
LSDAPVVLDASAVPALLHNEPGADSVARLPPGGIISAVNLSEVIAKLADRGMPEADARAALDGLDMDVRAFDADCAWLAADLRRRRRGLG